MAKLPGNEQLLDPQGKPLGSLRDISFLDYDHKESIFTRLLPARLLDVLKKLSETGNALDMLSFVCPPGLGILRIEAKKGPGDDDRIFFLELADTPFGQMELSFCIINDPNAPRYNVDKDEYGRNNYFATEGRNIPEEIRAMNSGLFPNQTHRGMRMFSEFFPLFERFVDALGMDVIIAEPLSYDNAIRYENLGFDYIKGKRLMLRINEEFRPGGVLFQRLDGSTPFRLRGMEKTVHGRSWAIHDGILGEPWNDINIYRMVGHPANVATLNL